MSSEEGKPPVELETYVEYTEDILEALPVEYGEAAEEAAPREDEEQVYLGRNNWNWFSSSHRHNVLNMFCGFFSNFACCPDDFRPDKDPTSDPTKRRGLTGSATLFLT
jgi:hypothetical protein